MTSADTHAAFPRLTDALTWAKADDVERRARHRRPEQRAVKLLDPAGGFYFAGRTTDVSPTGLGMILPDRAPAVVGTTAYVHVATSGEGAVVARSAMVPVRFAWVRRVGRETHCGVEVLSAVTTGRRAA